MSSENGRFVWYELMTTDPAAARSFYGAVVGWGAMSGQIPGMEYSMFTQGEVPFAGLMELPESARNLGAPPSWVGYIAVASVDATAADVTAQGGAVHVPPTDIPGVGRFAIVADPQGAALAVYTSANPSPPDAPDAPSPIGWHELYANDGDTAFDFYAGVFGWVKKDAMDMGPMGTYQMYGTADKTLGGIMNRPPNVPVPCWTYYFNVGNIDEAASRTRAAGGQILHGPQEVPGGGFVLQCQDPQGAMFALVGSR